MGLHKSFDRTFILNAGAVKTSGGSLDLAKGQFGIFSVDNVSADGLQAMANFDNIPKNKQFEMRLGKASLPVTRSQTDKSLSSFPFSLAEVEKITVDAPDTTEQKVDEIIIGYDGVNADTALTFKKGETAKLYLRLSGERIGLLGYPSGNTVVSVYLDDNECITTDCESCDSCDPADPRPIVMDAIEKLKRITLVGMTKLTDLVDITPVMSCDNTISPTETDNNFYTLTVCDTGDSRALALVQAQYPDYEVVRTSRVSANSTYQVMKEGAAPTVYTQSVESIIKGCEVCPTGYTAVDGGLLYAVTLEDEGVDLSATVETLVGAVTGTAIRNGGDSGVGYYSVVLSAALSSANKTTFLTANPSATVEYVDTVAAICTPDEEPTTAWVANGTCTATTEQYEITLPDNECGEDRLAELAEAYPYNTVAIARSTDIEKEAVITVTGTSGTANININGTNYLATFDTDIETTIDNFITTHAANILTNEGATVTKASAATISVVYPTAQANVTITNATTNLAGTVVTTGAQVRYNCSTKYTIDIVTNIICDECSDIFKDTYTSEQPEQYEQRSWVKVSPELYDALTGCLMGIRIKGKVFEVQADECLRDNIGFSDSSVRIEASGGYITEHAGREGIGENTDKDFNVYYLSRWEQRSNMGGRFYDQEDRSRKFFTGVNRYRGSGDDYFSRVLTGQETDLVAGAQYVDYAVTVNRNNRTQSFSGSLNEAATFHILVEVGHHADVEALINSLAGAAGIDGVKAYGA